MGSFLETENRTRGFAFVEIGKTRTIRFDPMLKPSQDDIVILTGNWPEHLQATADAISEGRLNGDRVRTDSDLVVRTRFGGWT